ncbi:MAG: NAD(P)H-hydrate epimerase, partial [Bryobacteraceae bacterium]
MKILTAEQMREADRQTTERCGIPSLQLMENAGAGVVEFLREEMPDLRSARVTVLCGKGNNGGDGLVAARLLRALGCSPTVYLFVDPSAVRGDAAVNLQRWITAGGALRVCESVAEWETQRVSAKSADLVVDALLGTGLVGAVEGLLAEVIRDLDKRSHRTRVLAVDTPSGLPSTATADGPVVHADWTVTFTAPKVGQLLSPESESAGRLVVHRIGTPPEWFEEDEKLKLSWIEPGEFRDLPLRRRANSNKGTYGHALLVAGSRGKGGAAALCGWAALRAGAGLATVATPAEALPVVASFLPELMTEPLAETEAGTVSLANFEYGRFSRLLEGTRVLGMGPGLTMNAETQQFVRRALA